MIRGLSCWPGLLGLAAVWLACGCQTTGGGATAEKNSLRSLFSVRTAAASIPKVEPEIVPEIKDSTELSLAYARWMEDVGNLKEARRHYAEVADSKPKNVEAALGLARIDQLTGRIGEAEQGFLRALRLAPDSPEALHALGKFYADQKRWPEAVEQLHRAMLAAPLEKTYRYDLAVALVYTGDIEGALPHFVRTVGNAEAHYNVGLILKEQGRLEEAEKQFLLAVTKKPDLHEAHYWLDEVRRERQSVLAARPAVSPVQTAALQRNPLTSSPVTPVAGRHSLVSPPATPTDGLTPQQREQLRNQRPL